jgi:hypothetical protein
MVEKFHTLEWSIQQARACTADKELKKIALFVDQAFHKVVASTSRTIKDILNKHQRYLHQLVHVQLQQLKVQTFEQAKALANIAVAQGTA